VASDSRQRILIVDDDNGVATLQRRRLERAGFVVEVAHDLDAAMKVLHGGGMELVVIDYRLGTTTGLDLHRRMKAAGFDLPVILVSAAMDDHAVIEAMRSGVRDIIVKNTDYLEYLPDSVRAVLRQTGALPDRAIEERERCVLVVDDDVRAAALQQRQLQRAGYDVDVAHSAAEAMQVVERGRTSLAVLDLRLDNDTSGLELFDRLKAEGWNIPAIVVTAFPDQSLAIRALRAGVRDFVAKSEHYLEYLPAAVDRVLSDVRLERKLVESELRLASIVGTTMDAIVMCDAQWRIVLFNPSAENMFAWAAADAVGTSIDRLVPDLSRAVIQQQTVPVIPGTLRQRREVDAVRPDGRRLPVELSVSDVVVHHKRLVTVIARDISERRKTEADLREADRRKDEFLGMLAHELRNPLAAIMTAGEVLHRTIESGSGAKLVGVVRRQARALARMVDDLLDVSRVTLGKIQLAREPLLLGDFVARAADNVRDLAAKRGLELELAIGDEPVWLIGDATRLEQVMANLLNNAVKFTPPGGRIAVAARREGSQAVVRVRDNGIGIERTLLPKVFDVFVQGDTSLDRSKSGLGIGLALVRQVVTLHGGEVGAFSSGPGSGSEFVVRLPVAPEDTEIPHDEGRPDARTRRLRILVVDDQQDIADSLVHLLAALGHDARAVYDGTTALALGRDDTPDVMLVDLGMPGMTGYDVARRVKHDTALAGIHLIALTGYGREEDRARVHEAGFDLHLTKPVTDRTLEDALSSVAPR
jgi:PAS domain S-box-containing protein